MPLAELSSRIHELPALEDPVLVANVGPDAIAAVAEIGARGRSARLAAFQWSEEEYRAARLWEPSPLVAELASRRPPGAAADLGCGTGRDAVYLASGGWRVAAVDRLSDALRRGRLTADRLLGEAGERIEWIRGEAAEAPLPEKIDLLLMVRFFDRSALERAIPAITEGGSVLLEVFTPTHRQRTGKPRDERLTLDVEGAARLLPGFDFSTCEEAEAGGRHMLRLIAQKRR